MYGEVKPMKRMFILWSLAGVAIAYAVVAPKTSVPPEEPREAWMGAPVQVTADTKPLGGNDGRIPGRRDFREYYADPEIVDGHYTGKRTLKLCPADKMWCPPLEPSN